MHETESLAGKSAATAIFVAAIACTIAITSCARQPRHSPSSIESSALPNAHGEKPASTRLNINTASAVEIERLPGVGKILAERVVSHREQSGPFRRVEHLMMVRGFSDHKFRALRELITVE